MSYRACAIVALWLASGFAKEPAATVEQEFEAPEAKASREAKEAAVMNSASVDEKAQRAGLVEEWDRHMEGFLPELLLTFPLGPRTDEYFYEDVTTPPVLMRGSFFASSKEETSSVDFQVTNPHGDVIYERYGEAEGLFHFLAIKKGTYTFIISNHKWMQHKMVTFAVGKGNETTLQAEHLDTVESHVGVIEKNLQDIQTESTYLWIRQKSHMKTVESIHRRVFWFCVVEFLILVGLSYFQVHYIKSLLSSKHSL